MHDYNNEVALVVYGDDDVIAVISETYEWFNQRTITEAFLELGHVYTDEAKTGYIAESRCLSDVSYLKRKFVFDPKCGRYIAPLDLDTILEIPQWTKKGTMRDQITHDNIEACLRELALHGRETFTKYMRIIQQQCILKNIRYRFRTYQEYYTEVLELPLFQSEETYEVCLQTTDFRCDSGRALELANDNRIPQRLQKYMQRRRHNEGYIRVDDKNGVVHVLMNRPSVWALGYKLERVREMLDGVSLCMSADALSQDKMTRLCEKCPWLKCDL